MIVAPFHVIRDGIIFEFQSEPEGGYTVTVPSLPGCVSFGDTFEEGFAMICDAIARWIPVARDEGVPIPAQFEHWGLSSCIARAVAHHPPRFRLPGDPSP